jgi:hypothetical protein
MYGGAGRDGIFGLALLVAAVGLVGRRLAYLIRLAIAASQKAPPLASTKLYENSRA